MDNKTKVKVAVVIGIVVLAVIFIFMILFVKGNRPSVNTNIPKKGEEGYVDPIQNKLTEKNDEENKVSGKKVNIDNVVCLGVANGNLVKINSDFSNDIIKEIDGNYINYCYGENHVYLITNNEDESISIIQIDITKSNYPETIVVSTSDYKDVNNLEYYAGKLYFVSERNQLIEFSISESYFRALSNENEVSSFAINENNNVMYVSYKSNNDNAGVYVLDFTANSFNQIVALTELPGKLIFNDESLIIDVKELNSLYVFDINNNSVINIGSDNNLPKAENHVTFYDNVLLYTDGASISLKKSNGESFKDNWYTLNDRTIADISMIDETHLQIARYDENGQGNVNRSIRIDLSDGTTETPDIVYTNIVKIK